MELVRPQQIYLEGFRLGVERSMKMNDSFFGHDAKKLDLMTRDPALFLAMQEDPHALGGPVELPNGDLVPRLPSITRWMWDGEVCGRIQFRWAEGTTDLPPHCLGHIGYGVFPWKRNLGYATQALTQILVEARELKMPFVALTTDIDNEYSQRVIKACGGVLHEKFIKPESSGGGEGYNFRIYL